MTWSAESETKSLAEVLTDMGKESILRIDLHSIVTLLNPYVIDRPTLIGLVSPAKAFEAFVVGLSSHNAQDVGYRLLVSRFSVDLQSILEMFMTISRGACLELLHLLFAQE